MNSSQKIPHFPREFVYFEKLSNYRLSGVHCLNNLVQAPLFDPVLLSEIANNLDEIENNISEDDFNSTFNTEYENFDYDIQVLIEALKVHGAEIISIKQYECDQLLTESMDSIEGLIFYLSSSHFFSVRKICNIWFNLNSTNPGPGPQINSAFYLFALIKGTEELGYTNFIVKSLPELPKLDSEYYKTLLAHQRLVTIDEILNYKPKKLNIGDFPVQALEKIEFSKEDNYPINDYPKEQFQKKDCENNSNQQEEHTMVMEISKNKYIDEFEKPLTFEPSEESDQITIEFQIFLQTVTQKLVRKFHPFDKIRDLKNYILAKLKIFGNIRLTDEFKNKIYLNDDQTLKEAGMQSSETLIANIID